MAIRVRGVAKSFKQGAAAVKVLDRVSFDVNQQECVAIVGPSGIGKTTVVSLLAGYVLPNEGSVEFDGRPITCPGPDRVVVSQRDSLLPWMSVRRNARYSSMVGRHRSDRDAICARADELLHRFGLWSHRDKYPKALSGGERRRVELVRSFSVQPKVLLLDEPYIGLDEQLRRDLELYLLHRMETSNNLSIVLVTHGLEEACFLADRILYLGGSPATIVAEEAIKYVHLRDSMLPVSEEFGEVVRRVRHTYYTIHGGTPDLEARG